jgi:hypothetical protein
MGLSERFRFGSQSPVCGSSLARHARGSTYYDFAALSPRHIRFVCQKDAPPRGPVRTTLL